MVSMFTTGTSEYRAKAESTGSARSEAQSWNFGNARTPIRST